MDFHLSSNRGYREDFVRRTSPATDVNQFIDRFSRTAKPQTPSHGNPSAGLALPGPRTSRRNVTHSTCEPRSPDRATEQTAAFCRPAQRPVVQ